MEEDLNSVKKKAYNTLGSHCVFVFHFLVHNSPLICFFFFFAFFFFGFVLVFLFMVLQVFIFCSSYLLLAFSRGAKFMDCVLLEFVLALNVLMCSCDT